MASYSSDPNGRHFLTIVSIGVPLVPSSYLLKRPTPRQGKGWCRLLMYNLGKLGVRHDTNPYLSITNSPSITSVQAIIFLAPLTFNLTLEEDPTVNRIEDSIMIWKAICSNRLLERTAIIIFLNKMDVLAAALESGLRVKDYVTSYGDLSNDVPSVAKCMSFLFYTNPISQLVLSQTSETNSRHTTCVCRSVIEIFLIQYFQKKLSPKPRPFFWHETSVIVCRLNLSFPPLTVHIF